MNAVMFTAQDAAQGRVSEALATIGSAANATDFRLFRCSVAYASLRGCQSFFQRMTKVDDRWLAADKQWLISLDYGQTDPDALEFSLGMRRSSVRIPNGIEILERNLQPRIAFHPKTYFFAGSPRFRDTEWALVTGSANLTFAALHTNCEHLLSIRHSGDASPRDAQFTNIANEYWKWWQSAWDASTPCTDAVITRYRELHAKEKQIQELADLPELNPTQGDAEIEVDEGARWATARYFWIETRHLYENRGPGRPGNQLDCRRGTRVFFGFSSSTVNPNTVFGKIRLTFKGKTPQDTSVRFGNNAMDKVNLPIPGTHGPETYDDSILRFERKGNGQFALISGTVPQAKQWKTLSQNQGMLYELGGGRPYGFYN